MIKELDAALKDINKRIRALKRKIESGNSRAYWSLHQMELQSKEIRALMTNNYAKLNTMLESSNKDLAHNEIEWNVSALQKQAGASTTVAAPTIQAVYTAVKERPFEGWLNKQGNLIYAHNSPLRKLPRRHMVEVQRAVQTAFITGRTTKEVADGIRVLDEALLKINKSYDIARRNVVAEARTSLQTYANRAREETYSANEDLFPWVEYFSTLDSRTSDICASLDGRTYRLSDESRPVIPQHWNCRSTYVPKKTRDEQLQGTRPSVDPGDSYEHGDNLTASGKVRRSAPKGKLVRNPTNKATTTFNEWLSEQDRVNPDFVRDYFKSDERYNLWKTGKLGKIQYTSLDGRTYNIKALSDVNSTINNQLTAR